MHLSYILKSLLLIQGIGFPIWIAFAWTYDITPDGIKKTKKLNSNKSTNIQTRNRLNKVIIAALSLAVIILLVNQFSNKSKDIVTTKEIASTELSKNNLVAVLPFLNTKPNEETNYLGFAIADQIIGSLVYLNHITVRPSSSVRQFENQTIDPNEVGKKLNVDYILIGNYLKENDVIRLNIELVNIKTNNIVWREPIEVNFQSVFELQDIVSKKVVEGLDILFSQKEIDRINKDIPSSSLAYDYYLRAISYPPTNNGDQLAIEMIKKSIQLDSLYAPSYSLLGGRLHTLANYGLLNPDETKKAEEYLVIAISLNPELISALDNLAIIYTETNRIEEAVKLTRKMIEISPNNANAHFSLGYIYRYAGMNEEAVIETDKALSVDNNNPKFRSSLITYNFAGEYEKALKTFDNFQVTDFTLFQYGLTLYRMGKQKEAINYFRQTFELDPKGLNGLLASIYLKTIKGDRSQAFYYIEET